MEYRFSSILLENIENFLSESFKYHNQLDAFLLRSGISNEFIVEVRNKAETRNTKYDKAPKRYVAQCFIENVQTEKNKAHYLNYIVDSLIRPTFKPILNEGQKYIDNIKQEIDYDKKQRQEVQKAKDDFQIRTQYKETQKFQKKYETYLSKKKELKIEFFKIIQIDCPQKRGFALEPFLIKFLELEGMSPSKSFKIVGEQIDGSFYFEGNTYLLECKWTKEKCSGVEFSAFLFKINGKSKDTRGLFLSINGYTETALEALSQKGDTAMICIDGSHLMRCLDSNLKFKDLLKELVIKTGKTGISYFPITEMLERA